ncbi:MAG TPA: dTDP-4-dehydrorhamnose reductase [Caulobacteraceae bacterium]|nr:dTDP-4-dehydrorhamnose reductase [Caulobacteraceae bacterium]
MRILVFGRQGQVARALAAHAGRFDLAFAGRERLDLAADAPDVAKVIAETRPDAVINATAYNMVDRAQTDATACERLNRDAPGLMGEACIAAGVAFVHFSTDYVFDGEKGAPYEEDDERRPLSVYGRAKAQGEARLEAMVRQGAPLAIIRTSRVFSPGGTGFLQTMLELARRRDAIEVVCDQFACPTPATACAEAALTICAALASGDRRARGRFHAAGADGLSWADFAEAIFAASAAHGGPSARIVRVAASAFPTPAPRPRDSRLACRRLEAMSDWRAPPLAGALDRCLEAMSSR